MGFRLAAGTRLVHQLLTHLIGRFSNGLTVIVKHMDTLVMCGAQIQSTWLVRTKTSLLLGKKTIHWQSKWKALQKVGTGGVVMSDRWEAWPNAEEQVLRPLKRAAEGDEEQLRPQRAAGHLLPLVDRRKKENKNPKTEPNSIISVKETNVKRHLIVSIWIFNPRLLFELLLTWNFNILYIHNVQYSKKKRSAEVNMDGMTALLRFAFHTLPSRCKRTISSVSWMIEE